ncbi:MAG: NAD(P)/FAD-dependent oxidoreductase [Pseudomonadota bacterium]
MKHNPHVVILGAGFAGLWAVRTLSGKNVEVTLIDKNNYHTFLPLLYQVGAAEISPEDIAYPVRSLLRKYSNVKYLRSEVRDLNLDSKTLIANGKKISFDYCIIATGSTTNYFEIPGAESICFKLKTLDDGIVIRNHILTCFERAAFCTEAARQNSLLTFTIVGGGPTGVEFAGALAELLYGPMRKDYPKYDIDKARIVLIESSNRILGMLPDSLGSYTLKKLQKLGVEVMLETSVEKISPAGVEIKQGVTIESETIIWCAGVKGPAEATGWLVPLAKDGRITVCKDLRIKDYENVYAAGDAVWFEFKGKPLPQTAPVAIQQGITAAKNILKQIGEAQTLPFIFVDKGTMVTIGRNSAVASFAGMKFKGFFAWLIWLIIHLMNLIGFRNKIIVLINWSIDYFLFERAVRLILPSCCNEPGFVSCLRRKRNK